MRLRVILVLVGMGWMLGFGNPVAASPPPYDPDTVYCPIGSAPFDGTNACACEADASVVLGQNQPDGRFEYWEEACPTESYVPPDEESEVLGTAVEADAPVAAPPSPVLPAFTG